MSVNGVQCSSFAYRGGARTLLSVQFFARLANTSRHQLLIPSAVPNHSSPSVVLDCNVSSFTMSDITLGRDWAACFAEFLMDQATVPSRHIAFPPLSYFPTSSIPYGNPSEALDNGVMTVKKIGLCGYAGIVFGQISMVKALDDRGISSDRNAQFLQISQLQTQQTRMELLPGAGLTAVNWILTWFGHLTVFTFGSMEGNFGYADVFSTDRLDLLTCEFHGQNKLPEVSARGPLVILSYQASTSATSFIIKSTLQHSIRVEKHPKRGEVLYIDLCIKLEWYKEAPTRYTPASATPPPALAGSSLVTIGASFGRWDVVKHALGIGDACVRK
ncbi:hypothetical protein B0H17DRAFT_1143921 [Mycena rosella]|uniref:Uncharacterized protein n=1 Tax=Mycena rosella TaxID=1033263 RepID=A0AAD7G696_MYCRO|nr:hypothetical protein B0H17DRAFT_1143921 [Mycena rosella]